MRDKRKVIIRGSEAGSLHKTKNHKRLLKVCLDNENPTMKV